MGVQVHLISLGHRRSDIGPGHIIVTGSQVVAPGTFGSPDPDLATADMKLICLNCVTNGHLWEY